MLTFEGVEYKSWTVTAMREKRYKKNVLKRRCVDPCSQCKQYFSIGDPVVECGGWRWHEKCFERLEAAIPPLELPKPSPQAIPAPPPQQLPLFNNTDLEALLKLNKALIDDNANLKNELIWHKQLTAGCIDLMQESEKTTSQALLTQRIHIKRILGWMGVWPLKSTT